MRHAQAQLLKLLHVRAAEPVDGLLGVAHREQFSCRHAAAAKELDQIHLDGIRILELIDE